MIRLATLVLFACLAMMGCSTGSGETEESTPPAPGTESATTSTEEVNLIRVSFANGVVEPAPQRVPAKVGDKIQIVLTTDTPDEIHVHGYEILQDAEADSVTNVEFVADIPGIFEVELHDANQLLFDIEVRD